MNKTLNLFFAGILALTTSTTYAQTTQQLIDGQNQARNATTTGIQPPPPPNYSPCIGRSDEASCRQLVDANYQNNLNTYNTIRQQELAAQQQQQLASQRLYNGSQQAAADSRDQNTSAGQKYSIVQTLTQVASIVALGKFASTCPSCQWPYLAVSIAMAIFSQQAGQQKQSHNTAAYQACTLSNQVTTSQQNCGAAPGPFNYSGYPNNATIPPENIIDPNGQCIASPDICNQITAGLPPGTSLRDFRRGLAEFASGKGIVRANPDGTFTNTKTGRTYSANDFKDAASMAAAGMSPADIAMASNMRDGLNNIAGAFDPNKDLKAMNGGGEFEDAAAQAAAAAAAAAAGEQALNTNGLGTKDRNIAAEGLAKDFNGELIGVAGDDIWKMMNRRYKLKTAQDSFMNSAKP